MRPNIYVIGILKEERNGCRKQQKQNSDEKMAQMFQIWWNHKPKDITNPQHEKHKENYKAYHNHIAQNQW